VLKRDVKLQLTNSDEFEKGQQSKVKVTRDKNALCTAITPPDSDGMVPSAACSTLQCIVIGEACM